MANNSPGQKELRLVEPKKDLVLESIERIEEMMKSIVQEVAITLIRSFTIKGQTFADAQRMATEIFKAFIASPHRQTKEGWIDFFVREVQTCEVKVSPETMKRLKVKLRRIQEDNDITPLFNVMSRFETLKANDGKGGEKLAKGTRDAIDLLLYDLKRSH